MDCITPNSTNIPTYVDWSSRGGMIVRGILSHLVYIKQLRTLVIIENIESESSMPSFALLRRRTEMKTRDEYNMYVYVRVRIRTVHAVQYSTVTNY